jgi:hypothetical protein
MNWNWFVLIVCALAAVVFAAGVSRYQAIVEKQIRWLMQERKQPRNEAQT